MKIITNLIAIISLSLLITSCGGNAKKPHMVSFTPASTVIDYTEADLGEATMLAQHFCASIDKNAQYVRSEENKRTEQVLGFFNCVAK